MNATLTLTARWLFPVDRPPLERGTITIAGDRIVAVEPHGVRTADTDLGNAAIVPGFVNAHTHLDLSGLRGKCPPTPEFTDWLRAVIRHRRNVTPEQTQADIRAGLEESLRFGTTLLGDIAAGGTSWTMLAEAPTRAVVFYELIGVKQPRAEEAWALGYDWFRNHLGTTLTHPGFSPHAPYSASDWLYGKAAEISERFRLPLATHLAEFEEERELLHKFEGPFVSFLAELNSLEYGRLVNSAQTIAYKYDQVPLWLFIHCNYFLYPELEDSSHPPIVYCPRTHAAFGHPPHPFREFLARGVRVALGTDSLASNPDLDLWAEACFVHQRHPNVPGETLLRMATLSGAEALGWADETGSLTPGKSADLVLLPLGQQNRNDPHQLILEAPLDAERKVMFRGSWRRPPETSLD